MEQGTEEWRLARCGKVTASRVADIIAKTKSGYSTSRANYMAELICERLTGVPTEGFVSGAMQHGIATEPMARSAYENFSGALVMETGLVPHQTIPMAAASPDGLIGSDGLVEIKCPITATHIETLLGQSTPGRYVTQMQWQMACTGRKWCDFVSFDPRMPENMQLFVERIARNDETISLLEREVMMFLGELDEKVGQLKEKYNGI
jgi:putative phage-type endonuclease